MNSAPDYTVVRFSSRALPEAARGKTLEELHERGLLPTKFVRYGNAVPQVDLVNRTMPGLRILTAGYTSIRREGVRQEGDHLYLCMTLHGTTVGSRRGREMMLSDGDAVLMTNEEATWTMTSPSSVKIAGIRLPRSAIAQLVPKLENITMRRLARDTSGLSLLRKYLDVVADDEALAAPASQRLIISHFHDLVALALGASSDARAVAADRTLGAVRLAAIKADIVANLDDGTLNATMVATRNRVSVRYLHKLFENEGITYSEFVVGQRLARAYHDLRSPLHSRRAISTIAFDLGFNDLSYFNRAFRRRYNATPSDIRNETGLRTK
ncbi:MULTISPECIES: helix-turn-helix domain-containing protein [unclassified Bradyrhizobium]|nr:MULTISPECIES: helix-turn-helix domain-containing protein [unclassified Bradyrhizobium]MBR1208876.1 helix-turn-helix domain-containing protein [Bradyrhizobium sp. AUGA SZCCT0124]MBR1345222.1 helix-turn-helix domain-containing protein [Bradyrhizobium sp. AUGA SZCCT0105]